MSRFFSKKYSRLEPYTPGEQPKDRKYIKLNTNESPFPPSQKAQAAAACAAKELELYPDPECRVLTDKIARSLGLGFENLLVTNGSDEILNFAFMAFCDKDTPAVFADITYGFYSVFADVNCLPYTEIPLNADFTLPVDKFINSKGTLFIANPNAPTGIALPLSEIERIVKSDPDRVVVVDEAYVDFGGESAVSLIPLYDNLLVTQTFSKSRSMAGARLGFGAGSAELIRDLNTIKYSTNPYNINRMTMAAGIGVMEDPDYTEQNCKKIIENREYTAGALRAAGFEMTDSKTNFLFVKHPKIPGEKIYGILREKGVLVRHFDKPRLCDYNRITIGSKEQMQILVNILTEAVK